MLGGREAFAVASLGLNALFWSGVFRYYRNVSLELSQYAQPPIKSSSLRAAIVSLSGFGLAAVFVFICTLNNTFLSDLFWGKEFSFLSFVIILLSVFSPLFNCLSILISLSFFNGESLTLTSFGLLLGYAFVFFVPSGYMLYKSRKEIEIRFQMAVDSPPKKLHSFKLHKFSHGNPAICGVLGALRGIVFFPMYLYSDLLRARQGSIAYRKVSYHPHVTYEEKIEFDVGQQLSAVDEATTNASETPLCPRCKKQLVFLTDQQKWWCQKCKKAAYVK
jgi:hypothetical protein